MRYRTIITLVIVVGIIGWAGLRPFDFAQSNGVSWIKPSPGLRFDDLSLALSHKEIQWASNTSAQPMTIEIWLRVNPVIGTKPRTLLTFVDGSMLTPLGFRQEGTDLVIWDAVTNADGERWYNDFRVLNAIRFGKAQHFAVTSISHKPRLYIDGLLTETSEGFGIPFAQKGEQLGGVLVIGAGPPWDIPWSGEIYGLAMYDVALTPEIISQHAALAAGPRSELLAQAPGIVAFYGFDEQAREGNEIVLPKNYHPPRKQLLAPFNLQNWTQRWFAVDVLLNLAGFACFGFLLAKLLHYHIVPIRLLFWVGTISFCVSLTIEFAQVLMVSRDSSLLDLTLNTIGGLVGAGTSLKHEQLRAS